MHIRYVELRVLSAIGLVSVGLTTEPSAADRFLQDPRLEALQTGEVPEIVRNIDGHTTAIGFGLAVSRQSSVLTGAESPSAASSDRAALALLQSKHSEQRAESSIWGTYPLFGGEVISIVADPTDKHVVYAGTRDAGVFKTTDDGLNWRPVRDGLTYYPIRSLRIDPDDPSIVYAGTDFDGIWKSTDGGGSWGKASRGLDESLIVDSIVLDPTRPTTVYAGLMGGFGLVLGNIYKSLDGGTNWERKDDGFPRDPGDTYTNAVFSLAIDPDSPSTLYAGTNFEGAFRTIDAGESWSPVNGCLPLSQEGSDLYKPLDALALNPNDDGRPSAAVQGHYYVLDNAQCWQEVSSGYLFGFANNLYFHPSELLTIYAAGDDFNVSSDAGVNWDERLGHPDSGNIPDIAFHPSSPDSLFAAETPLFDYPGGVYHSMDQGMSWTKASDGITALAIESVALDPQDQTHIYVGTGQGLVFGSKDAGLTWAPLSYESLGTSGLQFGLDIGDIAVGPSSRDVYVVGSDLYRSTNLGETFHPIAEVERPECMAILPGSPETILVGSSGRGIYKSTSGGETWAQKGVASLGGAKILSLAVDPNDLLTIWAGTHSGNGIFRSDDGGETWISSGLQNAWSINAIAVKPGNSNEILVGGGDTIYQSIDGGVTWQVKVDGIGFPFAILYHPANPNWAYAATEGTGVIRSVDAGASWQDYNDGIFYPFTYDMELSGGDPMLLVAGTYGAGLIGTALSTDASCTGDDVVIPARTYSAGEIVACWALGSIGTESRVRIQDGAELAFTAPNIRLYEGFGVEVGGAFRAGWE